VSTLDRLTCEEMIRKMDDYVDRRLSADEVRRVKEHLETCAICTRQYHFEETVLSDLRGKLKRIDVPPDLLGRISRLIDEKESGG
jgi:anti-sigma factor (TIGR02949 family)